MHPRAMPVHMQQGDEYTLQWEQDASVHKPWTDLKRVRFFLLQAQLVPTHPESPPPSPRGAAMHLLQLPVDAVDVQLTATTSLDVLKMILRKGRRTRLKLNVRLTRVHAPRARRCTA